MYRVRFHGRGDQGINTAARILGTAFFLEGYEVQDVAGDECYDAPILAYVRASHAPIYERGIMCQAELIIVADDSLIAAPTAGVLNGISGDTVLLIYSDQDATTWKSRLNLDCTLIVLPTDPEMTAPSQQHYAGTRYAGMAAQLLGVISPEQLQHAIEQELGTHHLDKHMAYGLHAFNAMHPYKACVKQARRISATNYQAPDWISLSFASTQQIAGGKQDHDDPSRGIRPSIDYKRCRRCWWLCSNFCPRNAIHVASEQYPRIDYDHCQGCMVCVGQCPPQAISGIPEIDTTNQTLNGIPA